MFVTQIITRKLWATQSGGAAFRNHGVRWMVGKAANRAAVHGSNLPAVPDTVPEEKVEIKGAIEEKERKRKEIENAVDSNLKNYQVLRVEDIVCSSSK
ncbi:hypothetical protein CASFOL_025105 [Castilleja foliolosa]|uniref:Uncharacterized protein n=1 Tax=Castilleja foliolosa TaxID=1961234 RepID=A0ABD3CQ62_9LAMI